MGLKDFWSRMTSGQRCEEELDLVSEMIGNSCEGFWSRILTSVVWIAWESGCETGRTGGL